MPELKISTQTTPELKISAATSLNNAEKKHNNLENLDYDNSGHTGFQKELTFDTTPTEDSLNPVTSDGIYSELSQKASISDVTGVYEELNNKISRSEGSVIKSYNWSFLDADNPAFGGGPKLVLNNDLNLPDLASLGVVQNVYSRLNANIPRGVVSGSLIKLTDHIKNESLISCKVYGTASGVGDLVESGEHAGKYRVAVAIRGKNLFDVNDFANLSNVQVDGNNITITDATNNVVAISASDLMKRLKKGQNYSGLDKWTLVSGTQVATTGRIALVPKSSGSNLYFSYGANFTNVTIPNEPSTYYLALFATANGVVTFENIQIEEGATYTDYEPYQRIVKEVYLDEPLGVDEYISIDGLSTISSVVYIESDNTNAPDDIEVEYYRDINKVISNLENAVLALGGNV